MRSRRNQTKAAIDRLAKKYEIEDYDQPLSDSKILEAAIKIISKLEVLWSDTKIKSRKNRILRRDKKKETLDGLAEKYLILGYKQPYSDSELLEPALKIIIKLEELYKDELNKAGLNVNKNED